MAKDSDKKVEVKPKEVNFVKAVKEATQAHGMSTFVRVNLEDEVSVAGLVELNEHYSKEGVEVWANGKSVLLVKS